MSLDVFATGDKAHGDDDIAAHRPVKIGGVSMTANPTKVADSKRANLRTDAIGRSLIVPYQVRELITTGFATLTRAQEGAVLSGIASTFLDLVSVTLANSSTVAISVQIRSATAGGVEDTIVCPATNTITRSYTVPLPDSEVATAWTAQVTGTTDQSDSPITVQMTAVRNV